MCTISRPISRLVLVLAALAMLVPATPSQAQTASWTSAGTMTTPRAYHTATLLGNGKVLVAGGAGPTIGSMSSAELYDPATNTWTATGSMTAARYLHTATLLSDGRVLIVGGYDQNSSVVGFDEIYDPNAGTFTLTGSNLKTRVGHSAALLPDGTVLVQGGCCDTVPNIVTDLSSSELWDPATGLWTGAGTTHAPHAWGAMFTLSDGTVLDPGGTFQENGGSGANVDMYRGAGGWSALPGLHQARSFFAAGLLAGDHVLVAGGNPGGCCTGTASAELSDPTTQFWTTVAPMSTGRTSPAAAVLAGDTQMLVSGGYSCCNDPIPTRSSAEIFDVNTKTWTLTASMTQARLGHTMTRLNDGSVLAAGGQILSGSPYLNSAERYYPGTAPPSPVSILVSGTYPGIGLVVTGANCGQGGFTTPATLAWIPGANCTITVSVGSSYIFGKWSDGSFANPRTFLAPSTPSAYSFTVTSSGPPSISTVSGTPQTAAAGATFAAPLAAQVLNFAGAPQSGATVTFTAPASGASGTFSGGSTVATAIANPSGIAVSPFFIANATAGTYAVIAYVNGAPNPAVFAMTNTAPPPPTIVATSGSQQTLINYAFANPLVATLKDGLGNPKPGVAVTFTAPATGASGWFTNGIGTAYTDANGVAVSQKFTANSIAGTYTVTVTAPGVITPASFTMINTSTVPASITATGGTGQIATINTAYGSRLSATVKDASGLPMSGVTVTFTPPDIGASVTFAGGVRTAVTNTSGVATSQIMTANATAGSFSVFAMVTGASTYGTFALTNKAGAAASIVATSGTAQSATVNTAFANPLAATVKDAGGNPVSGVTVTFTAPAGGASGTFVGGVKTATTNPSGVATSAAFTANTTTGSYTVTATVSGVATPANFSLTNNAASSGSKTLVPTSYITTLGSTGGQAVSALGALDQSGTASSWTKYVEFDPKSGATYAGYQTFVLPTSTSPSLLKSIQVQANYQGPAAGTTMWTWQIFNWTSGTWITVGNNAGAPDWGSWKLLSFGVSGTLSNYVRTSDGAVMVQLLSNNSKDSADIDYEAVVVTY